MPFLIFLKKGKRKSSLAEHEISSMHPIESEQDDNRYRRQDITLSVVSIYDIS